MNTRWLAAVIVMVSTSACGRVVATPPSETRQPSPQIVRSLSPDPEEDFGYELPEVSMFRPLGREGCRPPSPLVVMESLATSDELKVWALLFVKKPPSELSAGDDVKIVWRSDGAGDFDVVALSPTGAVVRSDIAVTSHLSSNWKRPGSEWESWFRFDEPGCWELRVRHGLESARLWLLIDGGPSAHRVAD